jgi:hypothetical protein
VPSGVTGFLLHEYVKTGPGTHSVSEGFRGLLSKGYKRPGGGGGD